MATVISYGGGVQSTALVVLAIQRGWRIDEIIHVDLLDAEAPNTREYVAYFAGWLREAHQRGAAEARERRDRGVACGRCA